MGIETKNVRRGQSEAPLGELNYARKDIVNEDLYEKMSEYTDRLHIRRNPHTHSHDKFWDSMPAGSKQFFVDADHDVDLNKLLQFWKDRQDAKWKPKSSWHLAYDYLHLGNQQAANNLLLNGAFLQSANALHRSLGAAIDFLTEKTRKCSFRGLREELPWLDEAHTLRSNPFEMNRFLIRNMQLGHKVDVSKNNDYVKSLSYEWKRSCSGSHTKSHLLPEDSQKNKDIDVSILDEGTRDECKMRIRNSMRLKKLFTDYAEKRNASLRLLRFSYEGKTLFLSSAGNQTPSDLGLEDNCTIMVTDITRTSECGGDRREKLVSGRKTQNNKSLDRKSKCKQKKTARRRRKQQPATVTTEEDMKIEHSKMLSTLHDEAEPQFKLIRKRLNDLLINRSGPKVRSPRQRKEPPSLSIINNSSLVGLGGKAGKSHFTVQVGEVANLYKSSKRRSPNRRKQLRLDLHGLTKESAIKMLDCNLPQWNDIAMSGVYPFVVPVEIICGCGSQALGETVEQWIKCHDKVANAPKMK